MSLSKIGSPIPFLVPLDKGFEVIPFQFPPGELTENIASGYAEANALNRAVPIIQFTRGTGESVTFTAKLFSDTFVEDAQVTLDKLKAACRRDSKLGRPPTWVFVWGQTIDVKVVVETIGGIKYGPLQRNGSVKEIDLSITLRRYEPFDVAVTDPDARPTNTFYRVVRNNDLWENLAARHYGDPDKGELLRRLNPSQPVPVVGQTILMPDAEKLDDVVISPDSLPLARTDKGIALARSMFALRATPLYSTVLKKA